MKAEVDTTAGLAVRLITKTEAAAVAEESVLMQAVQRLHAVMAVDKGTVAETIVAAAMVTAAVAVMATAADMTADISKRGSLKH